MKTKKISRRAVTLAAFLLVSASSLHMACAEASVPFDYFTDDLSVSADAVAKEDKYLPPEWFTKGTAVSGVDSDTPPVETSTPAGEPSAATPVPEPAPETAAACSYCGSAGHSQNRCAVYAVEQRGAVGRWSIPSIGIDVACFTYVLGSDSFEYGQAICDAADSAGYSAYGSQYLIADHNYQGFSAIANCAVGAVGYLDYGNSRTEYVCTGVEYGHNEGTELTDNDGNDVAYNNSGGITLYTCYNGWQNIVIVYFAPA